VKKIWRLPGEPNAKSFAPWRMPLLTLFASKLRSKTKAVALMRWSKYYKLYANTVIELYAMGEYAAEDGVAENRGM
jgi:hypothetical protein